MDVLYTRDHGFAVFEIENVNLKVLETWQSAINCPFIHNKTESNGVGLSPIVLEYH